VQKRHEAVFQSVGRFGGMICVRCCSLCPKRDLVTLLPENFRSLTLKPAHFFLKRTLSVPVASPYSVLEISLFEGSNSPFPVALQHAAQKRDVILPEIWHSVETTRASRKIMSSGWCIRQPRTYSFWLDICSGTPCPMP